MLTELRTRYSDWKLKKQELKQTNKLKYFLAEAFETIVFVIPTALLIKQFIAQSSLVFSDQ